MKRKILLALTIATLLAACLGVWGFWIEPNRLVVHRETISLPNWPASLNGLTVAVIADIHAGSPFIDTSKLHEIVALANGAKPDLILLPGDFMVQKDYRWKRPLEPDLIASSLKELHAPLGVYAVLGNHDWVYGGQEVQLALEGAGIKVIDNEIARVDGNGRTLYLVGLADLWMRPQRIEETVTRVPAGQPIIALTHNPDIFPRIPATVSLTVAGHTHGGQVNLPFLGRLVVPSDFGQRYAAGLVIENGRRLFVSTGIGTSIFPVRFRVPPEIAVLTLTANP